MGFTAFFGLIAVALLVGYGVQYVSKRPLPYEWLVVAVAGAFGAYFASENFPGSSTFSGIKDWGPELDGLALTAAIIGGVVLALVADLGIRTGPEPRLA